MHVSITSRDNYAMLSVSDTGNLVVFSYSFSLNTNMNLKELELLRMNCQQSSTGFIEWRNRRDEATRALELAFHLLRSWYKSER